MIKTLSPVLMMVFLLMPDRAFGAFIRNGSFEARPGFAQGEQGVMPPEWSVTNVTPDLYSTDGSFGLHASAFGNFSGVTAQDGLGWVAGWSLATETFAQEFSTRLTAGTAYSISASILQAKRPDLDNPGAYEILLNSVNSLTSAVHVATFDPTTNSNDWEFRLASFIAPDNADELGWIIFRPYASGSGSAYTGLDNVALNIASHPVPEPSSCLIFVSSLLALGGTRSGRCCIRRNWRQG